ncbi:hypothetical protein [Streptomyces sp. WMMC1477]|uniref:hypothetical protein n=1 Tax=Streptomyces sp. WMMC1477 TaxID=3015155 RepID=UPI0022B6E4E1|nr:hypothetical protein [Streptomyces sp. WMMC1477]MCZ7431903.1 hypothetical protein [Streptomyces sp. WMMC1477]
MTAGNNGTTPPEGDDPFGYLYRQEGGAPDQAPQQQGVPRTSYQQVRPVGERRYGGQQAQAGGYGYPPQGPPPQAQPPQGPQAPQGGYGYPPQAPAANAYPNAHYAAPETQPGGRAATRGMAGPAGGGHGARGSGHGSGGGQRRNGLLIAALAVVGAVLIGVGAAVAFSGDDAGDQAQNSASNGQSGGTDGTGQKDDEQQGEEEKDKEPEDVELPGEDASSLRLDNGPFVAGDVPGSKAKDGKYVTGMNKPGATVTWTTNVPEAGTYRLYFGYTVPGKDMKLSLLVNEAPKPQNVNFKNFAKGPKNDWEKSWTYTYGQVTVKEGENVFRLTCGAEDACDVALGRVWLAPAEG